MQQAWHAFVLNDVGQGNFVRFRLGIGLMCGVLLAQLGFDWLESSSPAAAWSLQSEKRRTRSRALMKQAATPHQRKAIGSHKIGRGKRFDNIRMLEGNVWIFVVGKERGRVAGRR